VKFVFVVLSFAIIPLRAGLPAGLRAHPRVEVNAARIELEQVLWADYYNGVDGSG
jgi:hypothetical protein